MLEYYFEMDRPANDGLCSDSDCPCNDVIIPRGTGYLYVSPQVVEMRRDAKTIEELRTKIQRVGQATGMFLLMDPACYNGILCCKQAARRRHLDLKVAAEDARYWWEHGLVPLRVTPKASLLDPLKDRVRSLLQRSVDDRVLFARLVSAMTADRGRPFVKAITKCFKLCEEGKILGLCAMEEAMRIRSGKRDLRFYWLARKIRTKEGFEKAQRVFEALARNHMLLADPAFSGDLLIYLTTFPYSTFPAEEKTELQTKLRKSIISRLFDSSGANQGYAFQLLDHHQLAQARLRARLGDEGFLKLMDEQTPLLTGCPNRPIYVSEADVPSLPQSLTDKLFG
jgi:hypothetical protein